MTAIVHVFAKRPVAGTVKTRLAADIGPAAALDFYVRTLFTVAARLTADPRWRTVLAVAPDDAVADTDGWPPGVARVPQGTGDLGERMMRVLASAAPGVPTLVVGSDIPGLTAASVARAVDALADGAPLVFGPSGDGGFWLVGASAPPPPGLFDGVRWSTGDALADVLANAGDRGAVALVDTLDDVDTADDLRRAEAAAADR